MKLVRQLYASMILDLKQWKVKDAVRSAELELAFQTIRGPPQFGRAGLGTTKSEGMPEKRTGS